MLNEKLRNFEIILASGSPRRRQFFEELDIDCKIEPRPVEEIYPQELKASEISDFLAELKASAFGDLKPNQILITSDTIVWHNNLALGKPADKAEAFDMLKSLSGKTHQVITSVCFKTSKSSRTVNSSTKVSFAALTSEEIKFYINNFNPMDKAGAYGIQEWIGLMGISHIEGSYTNVVGLPTHLVYQNLLEIANRI